MSMNTTATSTQMALPTGTAETPPISFECMTKAKGVMKTCEPIMKELQSLELPPALKAVFDQCSKTDTCSQEQKKQVYGLYCPVATKLVECIQPAVPCLDQMQNSNATTGNISPILDKVNKDCEAFSESEGFTATMQLSVLAFLLLWI